jgi:DNA-binding HxlR family transcriptional regulator
MTSYGHFCLGARALEKVGDRWSLLIVRDLLQGPRRFGDLTRLLTNVTPKWLTIRLRQLEADGIVRRDHQPGRREVWYHLTEKGQDLRPVLEALLAWGLKYERHPLGEDEAAHPEHLLLGVSTALNQRAVRPGRPRVWRFEFGDEDGAFALVFDGEGWSVGNGDQPTDVVVRTTPRAWAEFITRPLAKRRLPSREIGLSGSEDRVSELVEAFGAERAGRPA